jgi:hypothetical protein
MNFESSPKLSDRILGLDGGVLLLNWAPSLLINSPALDTTSFS